MTDKTQGMRFDRGVVRKATLTREGFLKADAIVTRTGIFEYRNADGSVRLELRDPKDVFNTDSLESMKMLPITNGHPAEKLVTSENAKVLQVGHTGESINADGSFVVTSLKVTDAKAIADIKSGKRRELSLGYTVDVIAEDGIHEGKPYTHKQANIRYNHLAIVDRARAGSDARIHLDANDAQEIETETYSQFIKERDMTDIALSNVTLDGIDYKAAPEVSNALKKAFSKIEAEKTRADGLAVESEKLKAERDDLKEKLEKAQAINVDEMVQAGIKARLAVLEGVKKIMGDKVDEIKVDGISEKEIRKAVLKAKCPAVEIEKKSDVYVEARFDALLEAALAEPMAKTRQAAAPTQEAKSDAKESANDARAKMIAEMKAGASK